MYVVKIDRPRGEAQPVWIEHEDQVNWSDIGEVIPGDYETWEAANAAAREWEESQIAGL